MSEFWLDIGAGINAEHWAAGRVPSVVRRIAMDPLLTSAMVESGRLEPLPPDVIRVGAELRPERSVETGKQPSYLPFADGSLARVHCGFVLHLYLEILHRLASEAHRVLRPGGVLEVILPDLGDPRSQQILDTTELALREAFGNSRRSRYEGPFDTFWADLYQDRAWILRCWKRPVCVEEE